MNIRERHHLIKPAIGVHPREQESYDLATSLLYATPCVVIISAVLDQILITIYMNWIHPWRGIVENKMDPIADQAEPNDPGNLQNAIQDMIPLPTLNPPQSESKEDPIADQEEPNDPGNLQNAIQDMIPLLTLNLAQGESNQGDQITEADM